MPERAAGKPGQSASRVQSRSWQGRGFSRSLLRAARSVARIPAVRIPHLGQIAPCRSRDDPGRPILSSSAEIGCQHPRSHRQTAGRVFAPERAPSNVECHSSGHGSCKCVDGRVAVSCRSSRSGRMAAQAFRRTQVRPTARPRGDGGDFRKRDQGVALLWTGALGPASINLTTPPSPAIPLRMSAEPSAKRETQAASCGSQYQNYLEKSPRVRSRPARFVDVRIRDPWTGFRPWHRCWRGHCAALGDPRYGKHVLADKGLDALLNDQSATGQTIACPAGRAAAPPGPHPRPPPDWPRFSGSG